MDDQYKQLIRYVRDHMHRGVPEEQLYQTLTGTGWPHEWVMHAMGRIRDELNASMRQAETVLPEVPVEFQQVENTLTKQSKYRVFTALADAWRMIRFNAVAYTVSLLAGTGLYIVTTMVATILALGLGMLFGFGGMIVLLIVAGALGLLAQAFIVACGSLVIFSSYHQLTINPAEAMQSAWRRTPRFTLSSILVYLSILAPLLVTGLFGLLIGGFAGIETNITFALVGALLAVVSLVVGLLFFMRYMFVPLIVLFESRRSWRETFKRSNQLMTGGGKWFMVKAGLLTMVIALVLAFLTQAITPTVAPSDNPLFVVPMLVVSLMLQATWVLLYLARRKVIDSPTAG